MGGDVVSGSGTLREQIAVRAGATLAANLVRGALSFASGALIARGLGVSSYGDLQFLLASFAAFSQLLDMGTSSAFYTFIAQRPRSWSFFLLYLGWMGSQFLAALLLVGLWLPVGVLQQLWVGQERAIVLLACGASFLSTQVWGMVSQLAEARRKTVVLQGVAMLQGLAHVALIALLIWTRWLSVPTVLWLLVVEYALLAGIAGPRFLRHHLVGSRDLFDTPRQVLTVFAAYCRPFVLYTWVGCLFAFADRWLLQHFGGSSQQGYFAIGLQLANVCTILTASILTIFWKEIAEACERQDTSRIKALYTSVSRGTYFVAAWLCALAMPYSGTLLCAIAGSSYEAAGLAFAVMLLYPVHHALGQISGTYFYATGQTRRYTQVGLLMMGVSLPVTYLLLASPGARIPGLGLGAVGLALKTVGLQVVWVNLSAYVIARLNRWAYEWRVQAVVLGLLVALGWICRGVSEAVLAMLGHPGCSGWSVALGAVLYGVASWLWVRRQPHLAGIEGGVATAMCRLSQVLRWSLRVRPAIPVEVGRVD